MTAQFYYKSAKRNAIFIKSNYNVFAYDFIIFPSVLSVIVRPPNTTFSPSSMPTVFDISIIIGVMIGVLSNSVESIYA